MEDLQSIARRHEIEYKPTIDPSEIYPYLIDAKSPEIHCPLTRAILLNYGVAPLNADISVKLAVDPRRTNLRKELCAGNLGDFLLMRAGIILDGQEETIEREIFAPMRGEHPKTPHQKFVYSPQEQIDAALAHFVPEYLPRKAVQEAYIKRMQELMNQTYQTLLRFSRGETKLVIPPNLRGMKSNPAQIYAPGTGSTTPIAVSKSCPLEEICSRGHRMPIAYDDKVWPTIVWLENFTYTPLSINGIFDDFDNILQGSHMEQRVAFDDISCLTHSSLLNWVSNHKYITSTREEAKKLPGANARGNLSNWNILRRYFRRHPEDVRVKIAQRVGSGVIAEIEQALQSPDTLLTAVDILRRNNALDILKSKLTDHLSLDLVASMPLMDGKSQLKLIDEALISNGIQPAETSDTQEGYLENFEEE